MYADPGHDWDTREDRPRYADRLLDCEDIKKRAAFGRKRKPVWPSLSGTKRLLSTLSTGTRLRLSCLASLWLFEAVVTVVKALISGSNKKKPLCRRVGHAFGEVSWFRGGLLHVMGVLLFAFGLELL